MIKLDMKDINRRSKLGVMNDIFKIRISSILKEDFNKACEENEVQASAIIREFMTEYVRFAKEKRK